MTDMSQHKLPTDISAPGDSATLLRQKISAEIISLNRLSTRGIVALALFLIISILAWWEFFFLPAPDTVTAFLGKPPSSRIISIVLMLYTFSALLLSLSRMTTGIEHKSSFNHVCYLTAFFLFYYFGKSLNENYWAVFGAGITILGVESYRIWLFCNEALAKKKEQLKFVERNGRMPPEE